MAGLRFIALANVHLESFCAGITITDFFSYVQYPMTVNGGATVTLAECTFIDNVAAIRNDTSEYFEFEEVLDGTVQLVVLVARTSH
jgi:hypothetical protein